MSTFSLHDLSFSFAGSQKKLFNNKFITVELGSFVMMQGRNGAGKSTLLKLIQAQPLFDTCSLTGTMQVAGQSFPLYSAQHKQFAYDHIGYVDQKFDYVLAPHLTFQENLACAAFRHYPSIFKKVVSEPIPDLIKEFNVPLNQPVQKLSGGQRQILAILLSLQNSPTLLLLDEPTAALDAQNAHMVMQFLTKLVNEQGVTVLMICHDTELYKYAKNERIVI